MQEVKDDKKKSHLILDSCVDNISSSTSCNDSTSNTLHSPENLNGDSL